MDIQLEKIKIIQKLAEVEEEWVLRGIKRLLGLSDLEEDDFVKKYESNLRPMSQQELMDRALEAEEDFKAGRFVELETYLKSVEP
ncbi:MAG: hypothetical protein K9J37_20900 [Saprospiraceae bacterium]|nr:hypothetical protein [Saprospiraceae bacterium]MCF8252379.1 hypothetical protein [Saprospiraceae bacterium]MCF8282249.1 hypothetical protein [Bacteroidales bacterium]MCF8313997.1 hypothetical protein [Saprospiraceae bacterium]MCF8442709.1 hypothetical protein [Saprospiraceae bacterium]